MIEQEALTPGDILRAAREEVGISIPAMAKRIGYDRGNLDRVEANKLNVTPDVLRGYEEVVGRRLGIIPTAKSRKNPEPKHTTHQHAFHVIATDLTLVRWCDCGVTFTSTRSGGDTPFSPWKEIPKEEGDHHATV